MRPAVALASLAGVAAALVSAAPAVGAGTKITARGSEFGRILWGPKRQAIYIFERDKRNRSRCYEDCAELWPPVYTTGKPVAGRGPNGRRRP